MGYYVHNSGNRYTNTGWRTYIGCRDSLGSQYPRDLVQLKNLGVRHPRNKARKKVSDDCAYVYINSPSYT